MSATQALLLVLESAERERDESMSSLEAARRAYDAARQQAQSLVDWRREYQQRWQNQFRQTGGMEIMRCYQDFMLRLADAVGEQDKRVEQAQLYLERCRVQLIECERKVAAVAKLIDKRQAEMQLRQNRQEQKATDEMAARAVRMAATLNVGSNPLTSSSF